MNDFANYRAGLYIRLSKEDDGDFESQSVTNQRSLLEKFASDKNILVYDQYIDDGFSGTNFDRPAFQRMLSDIESKKINMVLTKDMSRLGRDYIDTGYYMEKYFPQKHVRYLSLLDGVDTGIESSANDITPFRAIMNDMYAKDISKKILSVKHDKQQKGLFIGSKAPYGYQKDPNNCNKLIVDPKAAIVVKSIFSMGASGQSGRQIARILNDNHVLSPARYAGKPSDTKKPFSGLWSSESVLWILKNEVYLGNMVQRKSRKINYKSKQSERLPQEDWMVVPHQHEAIVDDVTFREANQWICLRKNTRDRQYHYPLKGLVFCRECGYPLGVVNRPRADQSERLFFICRTYQRFTHMKKCTCHSVKEETIMALVSQKIREICDHYLDKTLLKKKARVFLEKMQGAASKDNQVSEQKRYQQQIDMLYRDRLNHILKEEDFVRIYKQLAEQKQQSEKQYQSYVSPESKLDSYLEDFLKDGLYQANGLICFLQKIEYSD